MTTLRTMVLKTGTWRFRVGQKYVVLVSPQGLKRAVDIVSLICGAGARPTYSWARHERGQWKRTNDGTVFPSEIRAYIERQPY